MNKEHYELIIKKFQTIQEYDRLAMFNIHYEGMIDVQNLVIHNRMDGSGKFSIIEDIKGSSERILFTNIASYAAAEKILNYIIETQILFV